MDRPTMATISLFPRRKRHDGPELPASRQARRKPISLTIQNVSQYFHMPLPTAAKVLGVSKTSMKQICRRLGIGSWPYKRGGLSGRFRSSQSMSGQRTCAPSEDGSDSGSTFQINATQGSNGRATFETGLYQNDSQEGDQNWYPLHSGLVSEGTSSMALPDPGHGMLHEPVYPVTRLHGTVAQDHHQSCAMAPQIAFCSSMLYDRGGNMRSDIYTVASRENSSCREGRKSNILGNQLPLCNDDLAWLAHSCVPDFHAAQFDTVYAPRSLSMHAACCINCE